MSVLSVRLQAQPLAANSVSRSSCFLASLFGLCSRGLAKGLPLDLLSRLTC